MTVAIPQLSPERLRVLGKYTSADLIAGLQFGDGLPDLLKNFLTLALDQRLAQQIQFVLSYNRVIKNSERIYRLEHPSWIGDGSWDFSWNRQTPDEMCAVCPEVEAGGSIYELQDAMYYSGDVSVKRNGSIENFVIKFGAAEPEAFLRTFAPRRYALIFPPNI